MNITKQFSVLEDIYRLIDYIDYLADNGKLHFDQTGYPAKLERDNALWELKLKIKLMKPFMVDSYYQSFDDITEDERCDLQKWIADGNSIFDNPYLFADESGRTMDFINACRFNDVLLEEHLLSLNEEQDHKQNHYVWDDDLPF